MEVRFSPELQSKVADTAAREGRNPDEFVQDIVARYFDEEQRLIEAVARGDASLDSGDYLTHEQVGQRLQRFLRT